MASEIYEYHPHIDAAMVRATRLPIKLNKDIERVVTMPFNMASPAQVATLLRRVCALDDVTVNAALGQVIENFSQRHENLKEVFLQHYDAVCQVARLERTPLSESRRLLIGAYCTMEYAVEGAALFNPSMVPHPDQTGVAPGALRFVMSLRAVGEGHVSSTIFRTGIIAESGGIALDPTSIYSARTRIKPDHTYMHALFQRKLEEMGIYMPTVRRIMQRLPETFTIDDLEMVLDQVVAEEPELSQVSSVAGSMIWLARANYQLQLDPEEELSDLILFPRSDTDIRGIEDVRLVRFVEPEGEVRYFGTYVAYDGQHVLPMLMETADFRAISMHSLNGRCVQNKGMALFPRRINGHYAMVSRIDGQNLYLMFSDMVHFWESAALLAVPKYPWELCLMGNCGSPIETPEGWLLIVHGVGPMRRYCLGAMLLDLDDPFHVRGRLRRPLLEPTETEREGYVPNVVYSCGGLVHNDRLILPYAAADTATRIASIPLDDLLAQLIADGP